MSGGWCVGQEKVGLRNEGSHNALQGQIRSAEVKMCGLLFLVRVKILVFMRDMFVFDVLYLRV